MSFNNGLAHRHFILGSGSAEWLGSLLFDTSLNEDPRRPRRLRDVERDGTTIRLYEFFGGPNAGHVGAVVVRPDGLLAFASMHGRRFTEATVQLALDLSFQSRPRPPHRTGGSSPRLRGR